MECPLCHRADAPLRYREDRPRPRRYFDCPSCGLVFLDPACFVSEEEEKRRYDRHRNDPADSGYAAFLDRLAAPLAARLAPGARGLDYGSGPVPAMAGALERRGLRVETYDPHYRPDPSPLGERYDFVVCCETVEHFRHPAREFGRVDSLLAPGALVGISTRPLERQIDFAGWWYRRDATHVAFYRPETLTWIAARHGWLELDRGGGVFLFSKKSPSADKIGRP